MGIVSCISREFESSPVIDEMAEMMTEPLYGLTSICQARTMESVSGSKSSISGSPVDDSASLAGAFSLNGLPLASYHRILMRSSWATKEIQLATMTDTVKVSKLQASKT